MKISELQKQALSLSERERVELAKVLVGSIPQPLTAEEQAELDRAWEAYQANPDDVYSAEEVHKELQALLAK